MGPFVVDRDCVPGVNMAFETSRVTVSDEDAEDGFP
jgi:hypothetical protein